MESSGTTVSIMNEKNNDSNGSPLVVNGGNNVRVRSRRYDLRKEATYILLLFLLLFIALFVIMTTLYVIEKRKDLEEANTNTNTNTDTNTNKKQPDVLLPTTSSPNVSSPNVCTSVDCVLTITELMKSINPRKDPCENFYEYACDGWIKNNPVSNGGMSWDQWSLIEAQVEDFLKKALVDDSLRQIYENVSAVAKAYEFYESCVNLQKKAATKGGPIIQLINKYAPWPVVDTNWSNTKYSFDRVMARITRELNINPFLQLVVQSDLKNSSLNIITIQQTFEFGLFHNQLIKNFSGALQARAAYKEVIYNMSLLLGATNRRQAWKDAGDIMGVEQLLARTGKGYVDFDEELHYGKFKLSDFMKRAGKKPLNWLVFLNEVFRGIKRIKPEDEIIVTDLPVVLKVLRELEKLPERTILNYLGWKILFKNFYYVSKEFDDIHKLFRKKAWGFDSFNLVQGCRNKVKTHFGMAISRVYVDKKFPGNSKRLAQEIASYINRVFQETLQNSEWMDEKSKNAGIEKVKAVRGHYGYPDYVTNDFELGEKFKQITIRKDSLFDSMLSIVSSKRLGELSLINERPDRSKWTVDPLLVNANYLPLYNTMNFPAAFLQPPFYDKNYIKAISFGGVGAIIGHELIHGFDVTGKNFDKDGNNVKWWTDETLAHYNNRTKCLVDQYNNFLYKGLYPVDGEGTLAENIADNVGMREAYKAYQSWIKVNGDEPRLPGTLFNNEQVFFLSFARMWCKNVVPFFQQYETFSVHSPSPFRVNGALQNFPEFSKVFKCPLGSFMNPEKKCATW